MKTVSMFEAKTNLSKYVAAVESNAEPYVIIARNGKPVAKIVAYQFEPGPRIGIAEDKLPYMDLESFNSIPVEEDFQGGGSL